MAREIIDMSGWKMWEHGVSDSRLTVIERVNDYVSPCGQRDPRWLCECNCSEHNRIIVRQSYLKSGHTKSCGCLTRETCRQTGLKGKKYNNYDLSGEYGVGWTSNTNKEFYFDLEDYNKIKDYCWREDITQFNYSALKAIVDDKSTLMHHVLGFPNCDHKNRNALDNRKENLRQCSHDENCRNRSKRSDNTSGVIGVSWYKRNQTWKAYISLNKKLVHIGYFTNKEDAIKARLKAEAKYYGEFAPQIHLFKGYGVAEGETKHVS